MDSPHKGLAYAAKDGKKGLLGNVKIEGKIQAVMCGGCCRVLFYGES